MALEVSLVNCLRDNCSTLRLLETTGAYNATTNPTGFGAPNPTLASVTLAEVTITLPDGVTEETFDVTATINAATIIDGKFLLDDLTMVDFGSSGKFPDGKYVIEYVVTVGSTEYSYTINAYNLCSVNCCLDKYLASFCQKWNTCDFKSLFDEYLKVKGMILAIKCMAGKGDYDGADDLLIAVQKFCKMRNCCCN